VVEFSEECVNAFFLQESYDENCDYKDRFSVVFVVMKIHGYHVTCFVSNIALFSY